MVVARTTWLVACLLVLVLCRAAAAQSPAVEVFSIDDGLPSQEILELLQHPAGGLWIGTRSGLAVYDGQTFHPPPGEGLPGGPYGPLRIDERGTLWVSRLWSPLSLFRLEGSRWIAVPTPADWPPRHDRQKLVSSLAVAGGEAPRVAVGTEGVGLWLWDGTAWTRVGPPDGMIFDLAALGDTIAVATPEGLFLLALNGLDASLRRAEPRLREAILALHPAADGSRLWILARGWLGFLEGSRLTVVSEALDLPPEPGALLLDRAGALYFGTSTRLGLLSPDGRSLTVLGRREGLASEGARALALDREANVWIGSLEGLSKIESRRFLSLRQDLGLLEDEVTAALETAPGRLVLGHSGGLSFLEQDGVRTLPFEDVAGRRSARILDMALDREGDVWIAASWKGLLRLDPGGSLHPTGLATAHSVEIDAHARLWAIDTHDLFRYDGGAFVRVDHGARDVLLRWITAADDRLFLSSSTGLIVLEGERRELVHGPTQASDNVYRVLAEPSGTVWVGTGGGLYQLREGRLEAAQLAGRPLERPVYFLLRDPRGRLWLGTDDGVVIWDGETVRHLSVRHGLAGRETNRGAGLVDHRGQVWIGTDQGISVYQEAYDREPAAAPLVQLAAIEVNGEPRTAPAGGLELRHDENSFTWHLRTIAFSRAADVVVRYRLDGFDSGWQGPISATATQEVRYTNVPPGRYVFRVAAGWEGGAWGEEVSSAAAVARPRWREPWFLGLSGLLLAGGLTVFLLRMRDSPGHRFSRRLRRLDPSRAAGGLTAPAPSTLLPPPSRPPGPPPGSRILPCHGAVRASGPMSSFARSDVAAWERSFWQSAPTASTTGRWPSRSSVLS